MPLNAGDAGCGAAPGPKLAAGAGLSESSPLLVPDHEPEPVHRWKPLTTAELEVAAGGPGWRKIRRYLLAGFWLAWAAMLAGSVAVVATSPRPVSASLTWWQKSLFYQVQPDLWVAKEDGPGGVSAVCDQLPYLKALSAGALILEGLFEDRRSPFHLSPTDEFRSRVAQIQHLLTESNRMGLKVVLDICDVNTTGNADESSNHSTSVLQNHISLVFAAYLHYQLVPLILKHANICQQDALLFWLERGVAGFAICDTDAAYSEQILLEWRSILKKFSKEGERILVVKQKGEVLSPLNATLVDVVMRSILPSSPKRLSAAEVRDAIKEHLQREDDDVWIGWTAGGKVPQDLKKLLLVLMMTLPGSPAVQYEEGGHASHGVNGTDATPDQDRRSALALLTSLSNSRSREEALLFGSFFLLPFNSSSPPVLAFLRSWGCVHFLVLVNLGPELCAVDAAWAPSLPSTGVFVASTETGRLGSTTLDELHLQPREAVVIKLLEAGSYS